jgi:hypothetical protein
LQSKKNFFIKTLSKVFGEKKNYSIFAAATQKYGFVAQLDRASDYESEGLRFESLQDHFSKIEGSTQHSIEPRFLKIRILNK